VDPPVENLVLFGALRQEEPRPGAPPISRPCRVKACVGLRVLALDDEVRVWRAAPAGWRPGGAGGGGVGRSCWPRTTAVVVTATTGAAQAPIAAARSSWLGSCRAVNHSQNAASARESAWSPKTVSAWPRRASSPSRRSLPSATAPSHRLDGATTVGRLARRRVMAFAGPRVRRRPRRPRCVTVSAQLVNVHRQRPGQPASSAAWNALASAKARGRDRAWRSDRRPARPRNRSQARGRHRSARSCASSSLVAARLAAMSDGKGRIALGPRGRAPRSRHNGASTSTPRISRRRAGCSR
jgi:hypothetical protein